MKIAALSGGVGGSKLLWGLSRILPPEDLTVIVNTGDDFDWQGLRICPDLDTVTYTLADLANPDTGWGIAGDSFRALSRLTELGCENWFRVGDGDLATHIYRTAALRKGEALSSVTDRIRRAVGLAMQILPMTNAIVATQMLTGEGMLSLQEYFVRRHCAPRVLDVKFVGSETARPAPGVIEAIEGADAVVVCPSNPFISIGPLLAVPGVRAALLETEARVLAVSPIVAGEALKGPAEKMLTELGHEASALTIAGFYRDFVDIFVLDRRDIALEDKISAMGVEVRTADTIMQSPDKKVALAERILESIR